MFTCKLCGRRFRSQVALGGHVSSAHPQQPVTAPEEEQESKNEAAPPTAVPAAETVEAAPVTPEKESKAAEIRRLLAKRYTFEQLTRQFGFNERTVRQEMEKLVTPEGEPPGDSLPMVRKVGKGVEVINPEAVLRRYMDGEGDEKELRGMMKLRAAMLMVMDLVEIMEGKAKAQVEMMKPILDLMRESRAEQDAAAVRARESVAEAAQQAAEGAAARLAEFLGPRLEALEQRKPDIATVPNPMQGVMARLAERIMDNVTEKFLGVGQAAQGGAPPSLPEGWETREVKSETFGGEP